MQHRPQQSFRVLQEQAWVHLIQLVVVVLLLLLLLVVGCAFFSSSAWLYRIKASRSRTLLSAFTQAAEKRAVSRVFLVWFGFAVVGFSLL